MFFEKCCVVVLKGSKSLGVLHDACEIFFDGKEHRVVGRKFWEVCFKLRRESSKRLPIIFVYKKDEASFKK